MLLGPSSVVVSACKDEDENEEAGASAVDVVVAATGLFRPLLVDLVVVVVVVDMAVRGVVDAAVCGVAIGDFSDVPSEMEIALVPPQPHMNPRAFFLMHSTRPAEPRRRDSNALMEGFCSGGVGRERAVRRSMPPDRRLLRLRDCARGWVLRKEKAVVGWGEEGEKRRGLKKSETSGARLLHPEPEERIGIRIITLAKSNGHNSVFVFAWTGSGRCWCEIKNG
jgi:hypothetical protein